METQKGNEQGWQDKLKEREANSDMTSANTEIGTSTDLFYRVQIETIRNSGAVATWYSYRASDGVHAHVAWEG